MWGQDLGRAIDFAETHKELDAERLAYYGVSWGGALGAIAVVTKHEIVWAIVGGLFVVEALSVIIQVLYFKSTGKRVFLMAPIHHHFELLGWPETTVIIRFWILSGIMVAIGVGLFYGDWVSGPGSVAP